MVWIRSAWKEVRFGRSVYRSLFYAMILFGLGIGAVSSLVADLLLSSVGGVTAGFVALCMLSGFVIGLANYLLFDIVVSRVLGKMAAAMRRVLDAVTHAESRPQGLGKGVEVVVDSHDAIGDIQLAFNDMTRAIDRRLTYENATRKLTMDLSACAELEDAAQLILTELASACHASAGLLYGDMGDGYDLLANHGVDQSVDVPVKLDLRHGPVSQSMLSGEPVLLTPVEDGLEWFSESTPLVSFVPKRVLILPLLAKSRTVGLVILACPGDGLSADRLEIVEGLRAQVAPLLQNALLHRKVADLAAIDDLTRILNRRFGMRRLREEFSRSLRHGLPLSVMMLDIDSFKAVNDSLGHDAGDEVLKRVSAEIAAHLRAGDVVCRYGGEEFMIIAPGIDARNALGVAERLRHMVEGLRFHWGPHALSVSISIGVASWPGVQAVASEELVTAADRALYAAKELGRNAVAAYRAEDGASPRWGARV